MKSRNKTHGWPALDYDNYRRELEKATMLGVNASQIEHRILLLAAFAVLVSSNVALYYMLGYADILLVCGIVSIATLLVIYAIGRRTIGIECSILLCAGAIEWYSAAIIKELQLQKSLDKNDDTSEQ